MAKLVIEYRTEDEGNYLKGQTYFSYTFENKTTIISIAPEETRKLNEIVYGIEKQLQDGYHLQKDEKFDIKESGQFIMDWENENNRMDNELYPYFKFIGENKDNSEKLKELLTAINESRCC